jgi:phage tail tube protein FII
MNSPINNIPIVAVVAEPVKKVKKVKRSNPLKGAMIDADLQEEVDVVKTKIVVEEDVEEEEQVSEEKINKVMGGDVEEEEDAEIAELERALEARKMRKALKNNLSAMKPIVIERRLNVIKNLKETLAKEFRELEALETLNDDELIETIMGNTDLEAEFRITAEPKKALKKKTEPANNRKTTTAERWALIKVGTQFRAKQKEFIKYYKKTDVGVVECNMLGEVFKNSPVFAGNQEAANDFKVAAKITYGISGWEFLNIYNPETNKAKSLKKWDGEMEYLNW